MGLCRFFNVLVRKVHSSFKTITFHTATITGLGLNVDGAVSSNYKLNLFDCLLDRGCKINSNFENMCNELDNLRKFFGQNSFGVNIYIYMIESRI